MFNLSLMAALLLAPALAGGGDADADDRARVGSVQTQAGQATLYEFENDHVDGETLRPEGVDVGSRVGTRFGSLIHIRGHFTDHLLKIARDV